MALDFDVQGALAAGYTLPQIADYLGQRSQFDVAGARKSGYSDVDIVGSLAGSAAIEGLKGGTGNLSRGVQTALGQTVPLFKGVAGLIGATAEQNFGGGGISTAIKNWGLQGYKSGMEKIQPLSRDTDELTTAWEKAKQGNFGALVDWGTWAIGYGLGQIGESAAMAVVGGVTGAALAPEAAPVTGAAGAVTGLVAKGAVKDMAQSMIEKAVIKEANRLMAESGGKLAAEAATKQATKAVASSIGKGGALLGWETGIELGSIYADAEDQASKEGRQLTGADLAKVWGTGILAGGVGAIGDKVALDAVTGKLSSALPGGRLTRTVGGAMVTGTSNAAEEGIQTMLERVGASKEVFSQEGVNDIINSMGAGFMGSAPAGAFGGIISRQRQDVAVEKGKAALDQDLSVGGAQKAIDAAAAELRGATDAYLGGVPPGAPPAAPGIPPTTTQGREWSPEAAAFMADRPMPAVAPQAPMGEGGLLPAQVEAQKAMGLVPGAERRSLMPGEYGPEAQAQTAAPAVNAQVKPSGRPWSPEAAEFMAERATGQPDVATGQPGGATPEQLRMANLRTMADRDSELTQKVSGGPSDAVPNRMRADAVAVLKESVRSDDAAALIENDPTSNASALQHAARLRGHAESLRALSSNLEAKAETMAAKHAAMQPAGTQFERDQAAAQRAVNLEKRAPAKVGKARNLVDLTPMTSKEAMNRLSVLRDMIANEGGNALGLAIVPHPSQKGKFAIGQRELPSLKLDPIESPVSEAEIQHRLETAALTGKESDRRAEDKQRQDMISRARASIEARGGVASPYEAQILLEANQGQPYDRIDPSLGRPASPDQVLTARTGILVGSEAGLGYSAPESKAPRASDTPRSDLKVTVRQRALPSDEATVAQARLEHAAAEGRRAAAQTDELQRALGRPAGENPVEALRNVQGDATTPADIKQLVDAANQRRDAAETAEIERMLADDAAQAKASANAVAIASQDETANAKAQQIATKARENLVTHLLERFAEPNGYFASAAIKAINKQLSVLQREPLTASERARIDDLLGRTRAFFEPNLPADKPLVIDRGADNSSMERLIPERGAKGPAGTPKPKVPRPSKVGGVPTEKLTNEQLSATASNEQLPAITRRSAAVELQAREEERQAKEPAPATVESLMAETRRYHSGVSATGDQWAAGHATGGHSLSGVGVEVGSLSGPGIKALAHNIVVMHTAAFVDSGAFGAFNKGRTLDFGKVLAKYDQITDAIFEVYEEEGEPNYPRPLFVMPDVIGDQAASLALIEKHKDWITAELDGDTSRLIIPIQKGDLPMAEAYRQIVEMLGGRDNFLVGIPSNKEAISAQEFEAFLADAQPRAVHVLGAAATSKLAGRLQSVINAGLAGKIHITADASTAVQQRRNNPVPEGSTRGQELEKSTLDQNDPGVTGEKTEGSTRASTLVNQRFEAEERRAALVELQSRKTAAAPAEKQETNADLAKRALDPKLPAEERRAALVELQSRKTAAAPAEKQQPAAAETEKPGRQPTELQQRAAFAKAIGAVSEAGGHFLHGRSNRKLGAAVEKGDWTGFAQALADSKNPVVARIGALALKLKGYSVGIDADAQETRRVAADRSNRDGPYLRAAFLELLDKMRAVADQIEQGKEFEVSRTLSGFRNEAFERYAALYPDGALAGGVSADKSLQQSIDLLIPNIPFGIITSKAQFREALAGLEQHAEEIGEARMRADASQAGSGTRIAGAVLGAYDAKAKRVTAVYERAAKDEGVMAHEAAHAVLSDIIDNPTPEQAPLVARLRELHEHVQGVMQAETDKKNEALGQDRRISYDIPYGATSLQEFVAEGIGNPDFQYRLSRIAYQGKTAWGKFTEFVANLLGLKNDNAFTEFLAIKEQLTGPTVGLQAREEERQDQAPAAEEKATNAELAQRALDPEVQAEERPRAAKAKPAEVAEQDPELELSLKKQAVRMRLTGYTGLDATLKRRAAAAKQALAEVGIFDTKNEAKEAQRQQPEMRVVKTDDGFYALAPKTEAQIAAQAKAARRIAGNVGANGGPLNINQFIASRGGLAEGEKPDLGVEGNVRVGSMWLFRKTGMSMDGAVEILREAGYLQNDDHNEARDLIQRTLRGDPQYTPEGWDRIAEAEAQSRYEDHLEAQREEAAKATDEWTPEAIMAEDMQAVPELGRASDTLKAEVAALLDLAAAHEIDTEASLEAAAIATAEGTENDYYQRAKENLQAAIAQSDRSRSDAADGSGAQDRPWQEAERGSREAGDEDPGRPGYALDRPTREEVVARQDQDVDTLDDLAQIRRESEAGAGLFDLKMQDGRQDNTGSLFSTQRDGDTREVKADGETHSYTVVKGLTNQPGLTKVLREIARVFGKQVVFFQSDTLKSDGFVRPGNNQVVHINADSKMSPVAVLGHEMMHLFKMDNPVAYRAIATVLARQVDAGGRAVFRADYGRGANMAELSADLLGNAFQDPGFLSSVFAEIGATAPQGQARSIVQRLVSALSNAIAAALKVIQGMGVQPGFKADMIVKDLQAVRSALRLAMVEYGKGQREQAQGAVQNESADGGMMASRQRGQDQTETPAFKRWFKDSKVVDADGKPLVVYHGTSADFDVFKMDGPVRNMVRVLITSLASKVNADFSTRRAKEAATAWFTSSPGLAADYATVTGVEGANVMPVYLSIQRPLILDHDAKTLTFPDGRVVRDFAVTRAASFNNEGLLDAARRSGADGLIIKGSLDGAAEVGQTPADVYVAFRPEQIKSAIGNNGEFDPANPDITMSRQRDQGQTDTPEFKRWFGNSKLVDENGNPQVYYHATTEDFSKFKAGGKDSSLSGHAIWLSPYKDHQAAAHNIGGPKRGYKAGTNVMPVYVKMDRPLVIDDKTSLAWAREVFAGGSREFPQMMLKAWADEVMRDGEYDGIIFDGEALGWGDRSNEIMVFKPEQIKSAIGNNGAFDPANLDITMSRQRIFGDNDRQRTPEQLQMMKNIGRSVEELTIKERIAELRKDLGKKLVQGIVDQFSPLKEISTKAYQLARLSKGASGAMEAMLHHGKLSLRDGVYDADMSGGVLERLGVPLHGEFDDFLNWVAGNRAARLMMEGRENLFSVDDIRAARTLADGTTDFDYTLQHGPNAGQVTRDRTLIYQDALKTFNEFNKNALDIAEQSGLIDSESRKVWESEFYVPFYRVSEEGFIGDTLKNGLVRQKVIQKLKGGQEKLNDLMSNTLLNWAHLIDAAAKNRAALASLASAQQMGVAIEASEDVSRQMAKAMGIRSQVVWAMDGGKRRFFVVEDKAMLQAITSLQYAGLNGPLMDAMSAFKHALTIGVTASPAFKIRNLARDSIQAIASAPLSYNLFQNLADGYKASDPKSQTYVSALASGGLIRFGTMIEGNEAARTRRLVKMGIKDSTILNSKSKIDSLWTKIEKGIMAYQELGNRGEEINRAALYKQLIDQGVPHGEAALQARDLMDFSLQGAFTTVRFLSQVVPFLNARLQGLYKLGRAGKEDPRRFAAVLGSVALASVALMLAYRDDDDWKKREDWDRNNYWWFKFGGEAFRIPKPFEIGAMATLAERGLDYFVNPEMTGRRLYENVRDILMDQLSMNPIPQAVKPILDVYANTDSFSGRPIEPMGMDRLRPDYRYTGNTSMLARGVSTAGQAVANQVNGQFLSPVQIDHLLHGYFSWLGTFVVGATDMALRPLTGQPERPAADFWKVATQGIVQDANSPQSRYVSQMYKQAKEVEQAYSTWNMLRKQGRLEEADKFLTDNAETLRQYKQVENIKQRETKLNERIRMIERSAMSADEKKAQISELQALRDQTARLLAQ